MNNWVLLSEGYRPLEIALLSVCGKNRLMVLRTSFRRKRTTASSGSAPGTRLGFERLEPRLVLDAGPLVFSELMAGNDDVLADEDGEFSDWLEIHNPTGAAVDLNGWHLTDDATDLTKWGFPSITLGADEYLVVFASDKDRDTAGEELHTNFKLDGSGEYLALVWPDGVTVASEFAPSYPPQIDNVSFGIGLVGETFETVLVEQYADGRAYVPPNDSLGRSWTELDFDDSEWTAGAMGTGYDRNPTYDSLIGIDLRSQLENKRPGVYVRVEFTVGDPMVLSSLLLQMKYDDGFVAYINGEQVELANASSGATADSTASRLHNDSEAVVFEDFDISDHLGALQAGPNVLAIHGLNDNLGSSDMLIHPRLQAAGVQGDLTSALTYLASPTPGAANSAGVSRVGPLLIDVTENPPPPADNENLAITARVSELVSPVDAVTLHYRVMFGSEMTVPMVDDGSGADATAADGVYTARIPQGLYGPGQMVRWYVTASDTQGNDSRWPLFLDAFDSPEYFGTVVEDASIDSRLPVLHWFVQNPSAADTSTGTRGSVFFRGEFYDNVRADRHGQSSTGFPKKSYDFDFNKGYRFRYEEGQRRVKDFNLLSNWADKAKVRNTMAYEVYADAGAPHHVAFPIRVQQNGQFFSTADWVEDGDDRYLERLGLDPNGALYKMYNTLGDVSGGEKKTRTWEGTSDLQALIDGSRLSGTARTRYFYDNINVPEAVNYLAATIITGNRDMGHKNYYVYRDSDGTGEWQILPWDVDLSFGRNWTGSLNYYDDGVYYNNPLFIGGGNVLMGALFNTSSIRQMYLRRIRTLMDEQLQPPGTPPAQRHFEQRADELVALIDPHNDPNPSQGSDDADLDYQKWGSWGNRHTMREAVAEMKNVYLPQRRNFLYNTQTVGAGGEIPSAQPGLAALPPSQRKVTFGTVVFEPASGNQDEEYIEIVNGNTFAVDVSGWQLAEGVEFTFQGGTVIPAGGTLYVSPDVNAFRARASGPSSGQGLFIQGGYQGHLSSFGETIRLLDPSGAEITTYTYQGDPSGPQQFLRISELMYHPVPVSPDETAAGYVDVDFEFIELTNIGDEPMNLSGVHFTRAVTFTFGNLILAPDDCIVVVADQAAFQSRHGTGVTVAGQFADGKLSNGGERVKLEDAVNGTILDFSYDDGGRWPGRADGKGASLELVDPQNTLREDYGDENRWQSSNEFGGSPGRQGDGSVGIVINEVLSHTDWPLLDSIELFNPTGEPIDVGGWYLSDSWGWEWSADDDNYKKYRIPDGTSIDAGGYLVFDERHFNPNGPWNPAAGVPGEGEFALSAADGDDVWLVKADAQRNLTHFADHVDFPAAPLGESFGRWPNGQGGPYPMTDLTLDGPNGGPRIGPLLISEVMYRPNLAGDADLEFAEIYNPTGQTVPLDNWRIDGVDFGFAEGTTIAAKSTLVVLPFDPQDAADAVKWSAFCAHYGLDPSNRNGFVGGYLGGLNDDGERLRLQRPDDPPAEEPTLVPLLLEDQVDYYVTAPWPTTANGGGDSLQRLELNRLGDDPGGWVATAPTPGVADLAAEVVGRYVFYNDSEFDSAEGAGDDDAIAADKAALLPGDRATFANYTSYTSGINGVMIDVIGLADPGGLSAAADLAFAVGNNDAPETWSPGPTPSSVVVREGAGASGSDRVMLFWPADAARNQWLRVTLRATDNTDLAQDDVFYFGNAVGEAGDEPAHAVVNATDEVYARNHQHGPFNRAEIDDPYDYNRDRLVNASDQIIARDNQTSPFDALRLITVPGNGKSRNAPKPAPAEQDAVSSTGPAPGELDWLFDFAAADADKESSNRNGLTPQAIGKLLATFWIEGYEG